jgi:RNA polymerase sigma-70 factor, ECF subfamily
LTDSSTYTTFNIKAFQEVFEHYYQPLCRFATGYVSDQDSAEEIVQQVFINLWEHREEIDPQKAIKSYLFTSVKNRCLNHIRDNKKFRNYYLDVELELEIPVSDNDKTEMADLEKQVADALDKLPEKCREVFMMCRFEDMKYKDVALKLDISQKTVEAQMSKALKILREELKDVWIWVIIYQMI